MIVQPLKPRPPRRAIYLSAPGPDPGRPLFTEAKSPDTTEKDIAAGPQSLEPRNQIWVVYCLIHLSISWPGFPHFTASFTPRVRSIPPLWRVPAVF